MTRTRQHDDSSKPESRLLDRRNLLLCGTTLTVACLLCAPGTSSFAQQITGTPGSPSATTTIDGKYLPPPPPKFGGEINLSASSPSRSGRRSVVPPKGAPNVLLIMTDDAGLRRFGHVRRRHPDAGAWTASRKMGLRYTQFHSTALCSPTRAALITGRNHHSVGFGVIAEQSTGYPGYDSIIGPENATIGDDPEAERLRHVVVRQEPQHAELSDTAWRDRSINGRVGMGFDYFYGFMGGETDQWTPYLFRNTTQIFPWVGKPGYNLITDMADDAIEHMQTAQCGRARQAVLRLLRARRHARAAPADPEWIDKFKGKFDMGWNAMREQIFANQKRLGVIPANTAAHALAG